MDDAIRWVGFAGGLALVGATAGSIVRTLVLPRGQTSRLSVFIGRKIVLPAFRQAASRRRTYEQKDGILAFSAPMALLALLITWLFLLMVGYALMLWPLTPWPFWSDLREAGSSLFTLGFTTSASPGATVVDFLAAASGLIVIALQIAYLPTIYSAFNRRERLVTLLQTRAGAPAWGPEILARSAQVAELKPELPDFYASWEEWAADVAESHSTYPVLIWFRSPHPMRSWIGGLLAVMDSAALYHALCPREAPPQARLCLRMGFTALRYIADVAGVAYDPDPYPDDPIELTYEDFLGAVHRLESVGFNMERTPEEAWIHFRGWRVNYEAVAYRLADIATAPPGPWSGPRSHLPDMAIVPQRPANRQAGDPTARAEPKADRADHRA